MTAGDLKTQAAVVLQPARRLLAERRLRLFLPTTTDLAASGFLRGFYTRRPNFYNFATPTLL